MSTTVKVPPRWLAAGNGRAATHTPDPATTMPRGELPKRTALIDSRCSQVDAVERGVELVAHP